MSSTDTPPLLSEDLNDKELGISNIVNEKEETQDTNDFELIEANSLETDEHSDEKESIVVPDAGDCKLDAKTEREKDLDKKDDNALVEDDGWLDIIGSGDFKKRIIKSGNGLETRPRQGSCVTINFSCYKENVLLEKYENFDIFIGELDVIPAFDLFLPLMEEGEAAEVLIPSRLAYGKVGREPDVPPHCDLRYEIEILKVDDEISEEKMSPSQAMELGERKKERGNFWYERKDYLNSITCYKRAAEILDSIKWNGNDVKPELSQSVVDARTKVYNNMAAAQLKMEAYDQALKSVDSVLKLQPKNCKARFRKGKILSSKGLTEEAIVEMKKAAELEPETKIIQSELAKLLERKKRDDKIQRAMYKRMFPSSPTKPASRVKKWLKNGSLITGSCVAVAAIGVAAYRQFYS